MFGLEYLDGNHSAASFPFSLNPRHNALQVAAELRKVDWDEKRAQSIKGATLHEEIADLAEDYPAEWIPTSEIQEVFRDKIDIYVKWLAGVGQSAGVLAADIEGGVLMNCTVDSPDQRDGWISLQMGQGHLILAVVENGMLMGAMETDILRKVELDKLPRIAKAKAEGRFRAAFEAMGTNQF